MTAERITNQMVETAALAIQRVTSFGHYEATDAALAALEAIGLPALLERVEAAEGAQREGGPAIKTRPVVLDGTGESQYNFDPLERRAVSAEVQRDAILAQRDALAAKVADDSLILTTAKASWDRGERDYWDYESDMRPFDPSVTELDGDDCDRGKEWLETVTEIITDFRAALTDDSGDRTGVRNPIVGIPHGDAPDAAHANLAPLSTTPDDGDTP